MWLISLCIFRALDAYGQPQGVYQRFNPAKRSTRASLTGKLFLAGALIAFPSLVFPSSAADNSSRAFSQSEIGTLEPKIPIERELAGGQSHAYRLLLNAGQYLYVAVEQKGIDVAMALFDPDGAKVTEIILPDTLQGRK